MRMRIPSPRVLLLLLFFAAWVMVLGLSVRTSAFVVLRPEAVTSDAREYVVLGRSLASSGFYSVDGHTPFVGREPGYSVLLALVFLIFGAGNLAVVYVVQALLHIIASLFLVHTTERAGLMRRSGTAVFLACLLFLPSVFHILFSLNRESFALSLAMLCTAFLLRLKEHGKLLDVIAAGVLLGWLILTYAPLILFPAFLATVLFFWRVRWMKIIGVLFVAGVMVGTWGARNLMQTGSFTINGKARPAAVWHVRGEQAEHIEIGLEPLKCLWAEYVSRDWSERSPYCSFNAVKNRRWPLGIMGTEEDVQVGKEGWRKIMAHLPNYLLFSLVDILELHLPYVNGWGTGYNVLAVLGTAILYLGCLLAFPWLRRREMLLFLAFPVYLTGVFSLTDATPRYLMPVIFCYALFAALGYDRLIARIWRT